MRSIRESFGGFGNRLFQLAYIYGQARSGAIPDIYVQDPKWFEAYKAELQQLLTSDLEPIDMVSLHVRRGDYLKTDFYTDLTETEYYHEAITQFPGEKFLVFCADRQEGSNDESDMEWCKRTFVGDQFEFFRGENEVEDWNAQASCKAHIIANSSFSYMSAYLGGGKTVAPNRWYTDDRPGIPLEESWIVL